MKQWRRVGVIVACVVGALWMARSFGGHMNQSPPADSQYAGSEGIRATFRYPAAWTMAEEQGRIDPYHQVRFDGPRNGDDTYTCHLVVRASTLKEAGGRHASMEDAAAHYRKNLLPDAVVESEDTLTISGQPAKDLTVRFTIPAQHKHGLKPLPIPVKARKVLIERKPYFYELLYSCDAREYAQHEELFSRLVQSFRLQ